MSAIRNVIITLIILAGGVFLIQRLGESFLKDPSLPVEINRFADLINAAHSLTNLVVMGIGVLVVLLIVIWILRKASGKKEAKPLKFSPLESPEEEAREMAALEALEPKEEEYVAEQTSEQAPEETTEEKTEETEEGRTEEEERRRNEEQ